MAYIFCYLGKRMDAADVVFSGLMLARYRGYDSWGIAAQKTDNSMLIERYCDPIEDCAVERVDSHVAVGHLRWATRGSIVERNAHPIVSTHGKVVVAHNGYIDDYTQLYTSYTEKGYPFQTNTDTEIINAIIEHEYKVGMNSTDAVRRAALRIEGKNSFVALFPERSQLIGVHQGLPLYVGILKDEFFIASHPDIITPFTSTLLTLEKGQCVILDDIGIELRSIGTRKSFLVKSSKSPYIYDVPAKKPYDHFLLKEIMDIDMALERGLQPSRKTTDRLVAKVRSAQRIILVGAGSSHNMAHIGAIALRKHAKVAATAISADEFHTLTPTLTKESLVCILSRSGDTVAMLDVIKMARASSVSVVGIFNTIPSLMFPLVDVAIQIQTEPETSVVATRSTLAQLTFMHFMSLVLNGHFEKIKDAMLKTTREVRSYMKNESVGSHIHTAATLLHQYPHIIVLGRGIMYPVACEVAHKIQEITGKAACPCAAGEFKHGAIATVSRRTLVIVLTEDYADNTITLCAAHQARGRGAYCMGISSESYDAFDAWMPLRESGYLIGMMTLFYAYRIIYQTALLMERDPDRLPFLTKVAHTY